MTTDAERVMGRGAQIRLADGKLYELRFDFEALEIIEEHLGTLQSMLTVMQKKGWKSKRIASIVTIMWAALAHTNMSRDEVKRLLLFRDFGPYMDALIVAFNRSMPEAEEGDVPNAGGSRNGSPGKRSTRSHSSTSAARRRSSGV